MLPISQYSIDCASITPQLSEEQVGGWSQEEVERAVGLRLVGLAVMANPLRPDSAGVVAQLQAAGIRTIMVTGGFQSFGMCVCVCLGFGFGFGVHTVMVAGAWVEVPAAGWAARCWEGGRSSLAWCAVVVI